VAVPGRGVAGVLVRREEVENRRDWQRAPFEDGRWVKTTVIVDEEGGMVLAKPVRDEVRLRDGDALKVVTSEGEITLRPVRLKPGA
jgi:AbrB family looped-hinge helix DNA binding protein